MLYSKRLARSQKVRIFHTGVLTLFIITSLSSPFVALKYSRVFSWYFFAGALILMVSVILSWEVYGGCPFTVWENDLKEREQPGSSYAGSCIKHYLLEWFGINIPHNLVTTILVLLFVLPLVVTLILKAKLYF